MDELKEKHLRPGRKITDQFVIAGILSYLIFVVSMLVIPVEKLTGDLFDTILAGDQDAAAFLGMYFVFFSIWIGTFLMVIIFKWNWPMFNAVKYYSPRVRGSKDSVTGRRGNRAGNNIRGFLIGIALGFCSNGFCILMSVLHGDIYLEYSGFKLVPFVAFLICVFIQSAAEELLDRWYLYQKLRRRYKAPFIAIFINSLVFMALHLANPGVTVLGLTQVFVVGILFSLFVYYYNGLWMAMAFHTAWNFSQSIFFGLPNSGLVSAYSVFRLDAASAKNGPFYNVDFGVEGSVGAVLILVGLIVFVILKNRGKAEHTDVWAKADIKAAEKAAAKAEAAVDTQ